MSQNRTTQLISNTEKELADLAWAAARSQGNSMSTYLRALIIADLKTRGLLTPDMIEEML